MKQSLVPFRSIIKVYLIILSHCIPGLSYYSQSVHGDYHSYQRTYQVSGLMSVSLMGSDFHDRSAKYIQIKEFYLINIIMYNNKCKVIINIEVSCNE